MSFFCSRIPSRIPNCIYLSYVPSLLLAVTVFDFPCFWWSWQLWGVLVRCFVERPSVGICLVFFSWLDWDDGLGERRHHLAEIVFARFFHYKVTLFLSLHAVLFWKEVTMCSPHLRSGQLGSPPWRQSSYTKLFRILLHRRFIYSP